MISISLFKYPNGRFGTNIINGGLFTQQKPRIVFCVHMFEFYGKKFAYYMECSRVEQCSILSDTSFCIGGERIFTIPFIILYVHKPKPIALGTSPAQMHGECIAGIESYGTGFDSASGSVWTVNFCMKGLELLIGEERKTKQS